MKYPNGIVSHTEIKFCWKDRIRILFGKIVDVHYTAETENEIGEVNVEVRINVAPIFNKNKDQLIANEAKI